MNWIWLVGSLGTFSTRDGHHLPPSAAPGSQEQGLCLRATLVGMMAPPSHELPREDRTQALPVESISWKVHPHPRGLRSTHWVPTNAPASKVER